jgi:hypothetical protein
MPEKPMQHEHPFDRLSKSLGLMIRRRDLFGLTLAGVASRVFAQTSQAVTVDQLPPNARALIGQPCDPGTCEQPICPTNPNVTCQFMGGCTTTGLLPAFIANASKGDLVLSPGDGTGSIGGLLAHLNPPQVYTHMGILVSNGYHVRHSTMSQDRLYDHYRWIAGPKLSFLGQVFNVNIPIDPAPAPFDGFDPDVVKYGWPGTITQSTDEACRASSVAASGQDYSQLPAWFLKQEDNEHYGSASGKVAMYTDPDGKEYQVKELSFDAVYDKNGVWRYPLIVKPCPNLEFQINGIRDVLHKIADASLGIRGHYRFYAYTDAHISLDPTKAGPPMLEDTIPAPRSPCPSIHSYPGLPTVKTTHTVPVVCSSFVWTAVQSVKASGLIVFLDDNNGGGEQNTPAACSNLVPTNWAGDQTRSTTLDGLYYYDAPQRTVAANWFHQSTADDVRNQVKAKIQSFLDFFHGGKPDGFWGTLLWILKNVADPIGFLAHLIGIDVAAAAFILDLITDMPNHVANQTVNLFASDSADSDSTAWQTPGDGNSVSPDNIATLWDSPAVLGAAPGYSGLYGHNEALLLTAPQQAKLADCFWHISPGPATLYGRVMREEGGVKYSCAAATVTCNCQSVTANSDGFFRMQVPSTAYSSNDPYGGMYIVTAGWLEPSTGLWWSGSTAVKISYMSNTGITLDLNRPSDAFRLYASGGILKPTIQACSAPTI